MVPVLYVMLTQTQEPADIAVNQAPRTTVVRSQAPRGLARPGDYVDPIDAQSVPVEEEVDQEQLAAEEAWSEYNAALEQSNGVVMPFEQSVTDGDAVISALPSAYGQPIEQIPDGVPVMQVSGFVDGVRYSYYLDRNGNVVPG